MPNTPKTKPDVLLSEKELEDLLPIARLSGKPQVWLTKQEAKAYGHRVMQAQLAKMKIDLSA